MFRFSEYFRKKPSRKYPHRFIQGVDYKKIDHPLYKYEMLRDRSVQTRIYNFNIITSFFRINKIGKMSILSGYRWDGPSGPTIDTPSFMRSSACHDVWFQCLRQARIPTKKRDFVFNESNKDLQSISIEDGMYRFRAYMVRKSVSMFGKKHTALEIA